MGVKGLPIEAAKVVLRFLVADGVFDYRDHRRQNFEPIEVQAEGWNQEDDQHERTDLSLKPDRHSETADNHEYSRDEAEHGRTPGEQYTGGSYRIGPAADVAKSADQKAPAQNDPQNRFRH